MENSKKPSGNLHPVQAGEEFAVHHAAGITLYRVLRRHRDAGYWECQSIRGISGTHHQIGTLQIFGTTAIQIGRETEPEKGGAR